MDSAEKPLYVRRAEAALYRLQESDTQDQRQKAGPAAVTYALLAVWEVLQKTVPYSRDVKIGEPARDFFKGE